MHKIIIKGNIMRRILSTLFIVLGMVSLPALANKGIAFVHGTGSQTDAYNDYWTGDFVNSVNQGLNNRSMYTVINCDFDQFMWDEKAAGCLAAQLTDFY